MKGVRMCLAGLALIPAILFLFSLGIGLLNAFGGAPVYGSQRSVMSLLLSALFSVIAFLLWPGKQRNEPDLKNDYNTLPDRHSRAEFIASAAAARLGISGDKFGFLLTEDLHYSPVEVMNLWDELGEDFGIDLSADDFPDINSIEELRKRLGSL